MVSSPQQKEMINEHDKNSEVIEIDSKTIQQKVKKLLLKDIKKQQPKSKSRFKGKRNEKIDV